MRLTHQDSSNLLPVGSPAATSVTVDSGAIWQTVAERAPLSLQQLEQGTVHANEQLQGMHACTRGCSCTAVAGAYRG